MRFADARHTFRNEATEYTSSVVALNWNATSLRSILCCSWRMEVSSRTVTFDIATYLLNCCVSARNLT